MERELAQDMRDLKDIDLSPIALQVIRWCDREFRLIQPLALNPSLDKESQELYVVEDADLTLVAYASTREALVEEINEQMAFMWDAYVKADETELAPDALRLRHRLLKMMWEVNRVAA